MPLGKDDSNHMAVEHSLYLGLYIIVATIKRARVTTLFKQQP